MAICSPRSAHTWQGLGGIPCVQMISLRPVGTCLNDTRANVGLQRAQAGKAMSRCSQLPPAQDASGFKDTQVKPYALCLSCEEKAHMLYTLKAPPPAPRDHKNASASEGLNVLSDEMKVGRTKLGQLIGSDVSDHLLGPGAAGGLQRNRRGLSGPVLLPHRCPDGGRASRLHCRGAQAGAGSSACPHRWIYKPLQTHCSHVCTRPPHTVNLPYRIRLPSGLKATHDHSQLVPQALYRAF